MDDSVDSWTATAKLILHIAYQSSNCKPGSHRNQASTGRAGIKNTNVTDWPPQPSRLAPVLSLLGKLVLYCVLSKLAEEIPKIFDWPHSQAGPLLAGKPTRLRLATPLIRHRLDLEALASSLRGGQTWPARQYNQSGWADLLHLVRCIASSSSPHQHNIHSVLT